MYLKLLKNEFQKNKAGSVLLCIFMTLSVTIAAAVFFMLVNLFTSISSMYETANPPHFLQMHKGTIHAEDIDAFNSSYDGLQHAQTVPMIDIYGEELTVSENGVQKFTLEDCRLDISFVKQNNKYDVLLDENRNALNVRKGEIAVPVILLEQYSIMIGDQICWTEGDIKKYFTVTSYAYDGQMNSTLCSSTRFLISDEDFAELYGKAGEIEYLIEVWFTHADEAADYQTAYEQCSDNLPKDGQAVTYTMIFLLSAMTDIMTAMVFFLAGILLLVVAMICLRYTIFAKLEADKKEIGTMKAIGISKKGISNLYLSEIRILMFISCITGYLLALVVTHFLTGHMERTFGRQEIEPWVYAAAIIICALVYGIILLFAKKVLKKLNNVSVVELLVLDKGFEKDKKVKDGIHKSKYLPLNLLVAWRELQYGYGIIFGLLFLVTCLTAVPYRMVDTMKDKSFCTYMGNAICDAMIEIEQGADLNKRLHQAEKLLQQEVFTGDVADYHIVKRVRIQAEDTQGKWQGIHVDTGKKAGDGIHYLHGRKPESERELAVSVLLAEELGKKEGDQVTLAWNGKQQDFVISGIYQDVTSGGKTAKAADVFDTEAEQYSINVYFNENTDCQNKVEQYRKQLGNGCIIEDMEEFVTQTIGGVAAQVEQAAYVVHLIGLFLSAMIIFLFLKLRITRESTMIAEKKAIGVSFLNICKQEIYPVFMAGGSGIAAGMIVTELIGERIFGVFFSLLGLGIEKISFADASLAMYTILFGSLFLVLAVSTLISVRQMKKIPVTDCFYV